MASPFFRVALERRIVGGDENFQKMEIYWGFQWMHLKSDDRNDGPWLLVSRLMMDVDDFPIIDSLFYLCLLFSMPITWGTPQ